MKTVRAARIPKEEVAVLRAIVAQRDPDPASLARSVVTLSERARLVARYMMTPPSERPALHLPPSLRVVADALLAWSGNRRITRTPVYE